MFNFFFWKHNKKKKAVVIKKECYDKLPFASRVHFHPTTSHYEHTHTVIFHDHDHILEPVYVTGLGIEDTGIITGAQLGFAMGAMEVALDQAHQPQAESVQFGGGDTEGGGAGVTDSGNAWGNGCPDNAPSYSAPDPTPDYSSPDPTPDYSTSDNGGGSFDN